MPIIVEHRPGSTWCPAYCRPRTEKVVAEYCERHGIPCYLPLLLRRKRYQRRTVETQLPMFPGYVFVQLDQDNRTLFLECHRIVHIVPVNEAQQTALIAELNGLQHLEAAQSLLELEVMPEIRPGTPITIDSGPLRGTDGIVEQRKGRTRVTVNVELLGQSVVAEMDIGELRAVDED